MQLGSSKDIRKHKTTTPVKLYMQLGSSKDIRKYETTTPVKLYMQLGRSTKILGISYQIVAMLLHSISTGIASLSQRQLAQNVCELPRPHDHDDDDDDDDASPVVIAGPGKTQAFAVYIYIYAHRPLCGLLFVCFTCFHAGIT